MSLNLNFIYKRYTFVDIMGSIVLTDVSITMFTAKAKFTNLNFHEEDLTLWVKPTSTVVRIGSNYGEKFHKDYKMPTKPQSTNNSGRRKKIKPTKERKKNGSGKYMNSQISFYVLS